MNIMQFLIIAAIAVTCAATPDLKPHFLEVLERNADNRIVGGYPTDILLFPYQVSLQYFHRHVCGGSIISDRWVVSAAHCTQLVHQIPPLPAFSVRLGTSFVQSEGLVYGVAAIFDHPGYGNTDNRFDYDITLIRLASALVFRPNIQPISLPALNHVLVPGTSAVVTGWGALWQGGSAPSRLHAVEVPILSNESCAEYYDGAWDQITYSMLCAGLINGGRDACQGDSGGPLAINGTLIGVVSWGYGCAQPSYPGVYANVPAVRQWIANVTSL
ncbi:trypsin-2-like [Anthonomus grandis grandis]|uniref:trypsin-2-like n=1 Tax=Anthonomus grandis grandis TaxID=2921223 RepID=UPI0021653D00|nr:trypsin-2-like [Anthonomus grandis grandis]